MKDQEKDSLSKVKCPLCGRQATRISGDVYVPAHCDNPQCVAKANQMARVRKREITSMMSAPIVVKDIRNMDDWEKLVYAIIGDAIRKKNKNRRALPGIQTEILVANLNELIVSHLPTKYYETESARHILYKSFCRIKKPIPAKVMLKTLRDAQVLK